MAARAPTTATTSTDTLTSGPAPVVGATAVDAVCCASVLAAPLAEADAEVLAKGFGALAEPSRLRLLSLIAAAEAGEVCACDLTGPLGRSQPTVSHHLKVLYEAGLVDRERRGTWIWYRVVPERLEQLRQVLARP